MTAEFVCTCGATGSAETDNKADSGPDQKHAAKCRGVVLTGTSPEALARIAARVREAS